MQGEIKRKNWSSSNPKKYPWTGLKNSYKRNLNENIIIRLENSSPHITFLMVHLLNGLLRINLESQILGVTWVLNGSVPQLISVFQAIFGWLGDVEETVWSWMESVAGKKDDSCRVCALNILTKHFRPIDRIKKSYKWVNFKTQTTDSACLAWKR